MYSIWLAGKVRQMKSLEFPILLVEAACGQRMGRSFFGSIDETPIEETML